MKLLICGVLMVSFCIQTIGASSSSFSDCEENLKNLKGDIGQFFKEFSKAYDYPKDNLRNIQKVCETVNAALKELSSENCSKEAECKTEKFLQTFYEARLEVLSDILALMYQFYQLVDIADEYRCKKAVVCNGAEKGCSCSCEAQTNQLGCDLLEFFDSIGSDCAEVDEKFLKLLESCHKMYKFARNIDCNYGPSCGENGCSCTSKSNKNIASAIKSFINDFEKQFANAQSLISAINETSGKISKQITNWQKKSEKN